MWFLNYGTNFTLYVRLYTCMYIRIIGVKTNDRLVTRIWELMKRTASYLTVAFIHLIDTKICILKLNNKSEWNNAVWKDETNCYVGGTGV